MGCVSFHVSKSTFFTACLGLAFTGSAEEAETRLVCSTEVHISSQVLVMTLFCIYAATTVLLPKWVWADVDRSEIAGKQQWQCNISWSVSICVQRITDIRWPDGEYTADLWYNVHVSRSELLIQMLYSLKATPELWHNARYNDDKCIIANSTLLSMTFTLHSLNDWTAHFPLS